MKNNLIDAYPVLFTEDYATSLTSTIARAPNILHWSFATMGLSVMIYHL